MKSGARGGAYQDQWRAYNGGMNLSVVGDTRQEAYDNAIAELKKKDRLAPDPEPEKAPISADFGKRLSDPVVHPGVGGSSQIYERVGARREGQAPVDRLLWRVERRDGVWGVYPPTEQSPASFQTGSKREAEKWAMDRAMGVPDPAEEKAALREGVVRSGFASVLDPAHVDRAMAVNDALEAKYGRGFSAVSTTPDNVKAWARVNLRTGDLEVSPRVMEGKDEGSWSSTNSFEGTLTHEWFHSLAHLKAGQSGDLTKALKAAADAAPAHKPRGGMQHSLYTSTYGATEPREAEAELFSLYHWGGADRPGWVIVWGETLHREMGWDPTPLDGTVNPTKIPATDDITRAAVYLDELEHGKDKAAERAWTKLTQQIPFSGGDRTEFARTIADGRVPAPAPGPISTQGIARVFGKDVPAERLANDTVIFQDESSGAWITVPRGSPFTPNPEPVEPPDEPPGEFTVVQAFEADRNGDPKPYGWHVIGPDGEWAQTYKTKREATRGAKEATKAEAAPTPVPEPEPHRVTLDELDGLLEDWFHPERLDALTEVHPKSGWPIKVGEGLQVRQAAEWPDEIPATFRVTDYGPMGPRQMVDYGAGKDTGDRAITHVYRGISLTEYEEAKKRGYLFSDKRGVIMQSEGTNFAVNPATAAYYLPNDGTGVIVKVRVRPEHSMFAIAADNYVRSREQIPMTDVVAVSPPIHKDPKAGMTVLPGAVEHPGIVPAEPIERSHLSNPDTERSRAVSPVEFQSIAAEGAALVAEMQAAGSDPNGLDVGWEGTRADAFSQVQQPWGGMTIDAHTGQALETDHEAYGLTVKPPGLETVSVPEDASELEFNTAMDMARERFAVQLRNQGAYLGVFHDDDNNRIDIDPVVVVDNVHDAEAIGAHTRAVGGAYGFHDGNGYWPPHVEEGASDGGQEAPGTETGLQRAGTVEVPGGAGTEAGPGEAGQAEGLMSTPEAARAYAWAEDHVGPRSNAALRAGKDLNPRERNLVDSLDRAIATEPALAEPMSVYRVLQDDGTLVAQLRDHMTAEKPWTDLGYMSTSSDEESALYFAMNEQSAILKIQIPAGAHALHIDPHLDDSEPGTMLQNEWLLPRGTSLRITQYKHLGVDPEDEYAPKHEFTAEVVFDAPTPETSDAPPSIDKMSPTDAATAYAWGVPEGSGAIPGETGFEVNNRLRLGQDPAEFQPVVDSLDAAIKDEPGFDRPTLLYRTIRDTETADGTPLLKALKQHVDSGEPWTDLGYMSTSTNRDRAIEMDGEIELRIEAPAGTKALNMDATIDQARNEGGLLQNEWLLPRGSSLQVDAIDEPNEYGVSVVHARIVQAPTPAVSDAPPEVDPPELGGLMSTEEAAQTYSWGEDYGFPGELAYSTNAGLRQSRELSGNERYLQRSLDKAIEAEPALTEPKTVYRVVENTGTLFADLLGKMEDREPWTDLGYMSTSTDEMTALRFALGVENTLLQIEVPAGAHALFIDPHVAKMEGIPPGLMQNEWLLPRGTSLELTGHDYRDGMHQFTARVVLDAPTPAVSDAPPEIDKAPVATAEIPLDDEFIKVTVADPAMHRAVVAWTTDGGNTPLLEQAFTGEGDDPALNQAAAAWVAKRNAAEPGKTTTMYRGTSPDSPARADKAVSSWALSHDLAEQFAEGGIVREREVDARDIVARVDHASNGGGFGTFADDTEFIVYTPPAIDLKAILDGGDQEVRLGDTVGMLHPFQGGLYLGNLSTRPEARGTGSGGTWMEALAKAADEQGIAIHTAPGTDELIPFYEKYGFKVDPGKQILDRPQMTRPVVDSMAGHDERMIEDAKAESPGLDTGAYVQVFPEGGDPAMGTVNDWVIGEYGWPKVSVHVHSLEKNLEFHPSEVEIHEDAPVPKPPPESITEDEWNNRWYGLQAEYEAIRDRPVADNEMHQVEPSAEENWVDAHGGQYPQTPAEEAELEQWIQILRQSYSDDPTSITWRNEEDDVDYYRPDMRNLSDDELRAIIEAGQPGENITQMKASRALAAIRELQDRIPEPTLEPGPPTAVLDDPNLVATQIEEWLKENPGLITPPVVLQAIYGDTLHGTSGKHEADLALLPEEFHRLLAEHFGHPLFTEGGSGIWMGPGVFSEQDDMSALHGVTPRGWPEGSTWDDVAGGYDSVNRKLILSEGGYNGSTSLALHEGGHAIDDALGRPSHDAAWIDLYRSMLNQYDFDPYFSQPGIAGQEEAWAEAFAAWVQSGGDPMAIIQALGLSANLFALRPGEGHTAGMQFVAYFEALVLSIKEGTPGDLNPSPSWGPLYWWKQYQEDLRTHARHPDPTMDFHGDSAPTRKVDRRPMPWDKYNPQHPDYEPLIPWGGKL